MRASNRLLWVHGGKGLFIVRRGYMHAKISVFTHLFQMWIGTRVMHHTCAYVMTCLLGLKGGVQK